MFQLLITHWYAAFAWLMAGLLLCFYLALYLISRDARSYINRVKLLKLRDELRFHVAMGLLEEKSHLFQHYDNLANALVRDAERYNLYGLMSAIGKYGKEILTKNQAEWKRIHKMLSKAPPEVQKTVGELYLEVAKLFMRQSKAIIAFAFLFAAVRSAGTKVFGRNFDELAAPASVVRNARHLGQQFTPA